MNKTTIEKFKNYPRLVGVDDNIFIEVARYIQKRTDRNPELSNQQIVEIFVKEIFMKYFNVRGFNYIAALRKFLLNPFVRALKKHFSDSAFENVEREDKLCSKFDLKINDNLTFKFSIHYTAVNFTYVFMGKKVSLTNYYSPDLELFAQKAKTMQDNFSQWLECLDYVIKEIGRVKLTRKLERTAIDAVITEKLNSAGIPYYIDRLKAYDKISFAMSKSQKYVFYLPHQCFHTEIDNLLAIVRQLKAYLKAGGRFETTYFSLDDQYRFE